MQSFGYLWGTQLGHKNNHLLDLSTCFIFNRSLTVSVAARQPPDVGLHVGLLEGVRRSRGHRLLHGLCSGSQEVPDWRDRNLVRNLLMVLKCSDQFMPVSLRSNFYIFLIWPKHLFDNFRLLIAHITDVKGDFSLIFVIYKKPEARHIFR